MLAALAREMSPTESRLERMISLEALLSLISNREPPYCRLERFIRPNLGFSMISMSPELATDPKLRKSKISSPVFMIKRKPVLVPGLPSSLAPAGFIETLVKAGRASQFSPSKIGPKRGTEIRLREGKSSRLNWPAMVVRLGALISSREGEDVAWRSPPMFDMPLRAMLASESLDMIMLPAKIPVTLKHVLGSTRVSASA